MLALGLSVLLLVFWTLVGQAVFAALKLRLGVLRSWLLAPGVGLAVVALMLMVGNQAGWPIGVFAWPATLGLMGATAAMLIWRRPCLPWRALAPFGAIAVFSLLWTGWPAFEFGFNWLSYVNDDFVNYCLGAERFKDFDFWRVPTMVELAGRDYAQYYWFMHVPGLMRFGSEQALAWTAALTGHKALDIFMPVILGLGLVQGCATAGAALHRGRWRRWAVLAGALLAASPLFMLGMLYQLIAQVGGLGLLLTIVAIITTRLPGARRSQILPYAAVLSVLCAALCIFYPEVTPFAVLTAVLFAGVEWARTRTFPVARLGLGLYIIIGVVVLLRHNILSYLFTISYQFGSGFRHVDLSLSLFPYFVIPTGLANLFGLMPLALNFPEPLTSLAILGGMAGLATVLWFGVRESLRPVPAACLLLMQFALSLRLFFSGNDFGLYKMAMFLQPVLTIALAYGLLRLPRARWVAPAGVAAIMALCAPTALHYTRASQGFYAGGITEAKLASALGTTLPALPPNTRLLCDINNLVAAKVAAFQARGTDLRYLSRDYYQQIAPIEFERLGHTLISMHPRFEDLMRTHAMLDARDDATIRSRVLFFTEFRAPELSFANTAAGDYYLMLHEELGLFNKLRLPADAPPDVYFKVYPAASVQNLLVFIHSGRGNHYYLGDRRRIGLYQQEMDPYCPDRDFTGLGRFLLLRVERPTDPFYLRIAATKTNKGRGHTTWAPGGKILAEEDVPLGLSGSGAANRIVGPIKPVWLGGAAYIAIDFAETATQFPFHRTGLQALYNNYIPLDSRYLVGYGRDISALSAAEVAALPRPTKLAHFPEDIVKARGLEFSGIYEDGWLSPECEFVLGASHPGGCVRLQGSIPPLPSTPPMAEGTIQVTINGCSLELPARAGKFDWLIPVAKPADTTRIALRFSAGITLPNGDDRPVGAKLETLEVVSRPPSYLVDYTSSATPRLAASGIDQDGWAQTDARIVLPASAKSARLQLVLEYPGWAGATPTEIKLALDGAPTIALTLSPGQNRFTLEWPAGVEPRSLHLQASRAFALPAPDGRSRSYRLVSLERIAAPAPGPLRAMHVDLTTPLIVPSMANGIDADGWTQASASIVVPAATNSARLDLVVEYPGWSDAPEAGLRLALEDSPGTLYTLKPGRNTCSMPLPPSLSARHLRLESTRTFRLPAPDNRERAFRALSLDIVPVPE